MTTNYKIYLKHLNIITKIINSIMGITTRCRGRSLYNHLKQKNIDITLEYTYDKPTLSWSGYFCVYGQGYHVENKQSKNLVLEALMEQSTQHILSHIKVKKSHK